MTLHQGRRYRLNVSSKGRVLYTYPTKGNFGRLQAVLWYLRFRRNGWTVEIEQCDE